MHRCLNLCEKIIVLFFPNRCKMQHCLSVCLNGICTNAGRTTGARGENGCFIFGLCGAIPPSHMFRIFGMSAGHRAELAASAVSSRYKSTGSHTPLPCSLCLISAYKVASYWGGVRREQHQILNLLRSRGLYLSISVMCLPGNSLHSRLASNVRNT